MKDKEFMDIKLKCLEYVFKYVYQHDSEQPYSVRDYIEYADELVCYVIET